MRHIPRPAPLPAGTLPFEDLAAVEAAPASDGVAIPPPPTANNIWRIFGNRMHRSTVYRKWLEHCAAILGERMSSARGPVRIEITVRLGKGFPLSRDLDNCIKPVIDVLKPPKYNKQNELVSHGAAIIPNDSVNTVVAIVARVKPPFDKKSDAVCYVRVEPDDIHGTKGRGW